MEGIVLFQTSPDQEAIAEALDRAIFAPLDADDTLRAYLLLDASQSPEIPVCLQGFSDDARCLFDGQTGDDLGEVAPWLAEVTRYSDAWDWFVEEGFGQNWGVIIHSRLEPSKLKTQLKKFLKVTDDTGEVLFFKYYRPLHFSTYIPIFDEEQRRSFWRGIQTIFAEDGSQPRLIAHSLDETGGHLKRNIGLDPSEEAPEP